MLDPRPGRDSVVSVELPPSGVSGVVVVAVVGATVASVAVVSDVALLAVGVVGSGVVLAVHVK